MDSNHDRLVEEFERRNKSKKRRKWIQTLSVLSSDEEDSEGEHCIQPESMCKFDTGQITVLRFPYPMFTDDSDEDDDLKSFPKDLNGTGHLEKRRKCITSLDENRELNEENQSYKDKIRKREQVTEKKQKTRIPLMSNKESKKCNSSQRPLKRLKVLKSMENSSSDDEVIFKETIQKQNSSRRQFNRRSKVVATTSPENSSSEEVVNEIGECHLPHIPSKSTSRFLNSSLSENSDEENSCRYDGLKSSRRNKFRRLQVLSTSPSSSDNEEPRNKSVQPKVSPNKPSTTLVTDIPQVKLTTSKHYSTFHTLSPSPSEGDGNDSESYFVPTKKLVTKNKTVPSSTSPKRSIENHPFGNLLTANKIINSHQPIHRQEDFNSTVINCKSKQSPKKYNQHSRSKPANSNVNTSAWTNIAKAQLKSQSKLSSTYQSKVQNLKKQLVSSNVSTVEIYKKIQSRSISTDKEEKLTSCSEKPFQLNDESGSHSKLEDLFGDKLGNVPIVSTHLKHIESKSHSDCDNLEERQLKENNYNANVYCNPSQASGAEDVTESTEEHNTNSLLTTEAMDINNSQLQAEDDVTKVTECSKKVRYSHVDRGTPKKQPDSEVSKVLNTKAKSQKHQLKKTQAKCNPPQASGAEDVTESIEEHSTNSLSTIESMNISISQLQTEDYLTKVIECSKKVRYSHVDRDRGSEVPKVLNTKAKSQKHQLQKTQAKCNSKSDDSNTKNTATDNLSNNTCDVLGNILSQMENNRYKFQRPVTKKPIVEPTPEMLGWYPLAYVLTAQLQNPQQQNQSSFNLPVPEDPNCKAQSYSYRNDNTRETIHSASGDSETQINRISVPYKQYADKLYIKEPSSTLKGLEESKSRKDTKLNKPFYSTVCGDYVGTNKEPDNHIQENNSAVANSDNPNFQISHQNCVNTIFDQRQSSGQHTENGKTMPQRKSCEDIQISSTVINRVVGNNTEVTVADNYSGVSLGNSKSNPLEKYKMNVSVSTKPVNTTVDNKPKHTSFHVSHPVKPIVVRNCSNKSTSILKSPVNNIKGSATNTNNSVPALVEETTNIGPLTMQVEERIRANSEIIKNFTIDTTQDSSKEIPKGIRIRVGGTVYRLPAKSQLSSEDTRPRTDLSEEHSSEKPSDTEERSLEGTSSIVSSVGLKGKDTHDLPQINTDLQRRNFVEHSVTEVKRKKRRRKRGKKKNEEERSEEVLKGVNSSPSNKHVSSTVSNLNDKDVDKRSTAEDSCDDVIILSGSSDSDNRAHTSGKARSSESKQEQFVSSTQFKCSCDTSHITQQNALSVSNVGKIRVRSFKELGLLTDKPFPENALPFNDLNPTSLELNVQERSQLHQLPPNTSLNLPNREVSQAPVNQSDSVVLSATQLDASNAVPKIFTCKGQFININQLPLPTESIKNQCKGALTTVVIPVRSESEQCISSTSNLGSSQVNSLASVSEGNENQTSQTTNQAIQSAPAQETVSSSCQLLIGQQQPSQGAINVIAVPSATKETETLFFRLCDELFTEVVYLKIPKLVDDLHLLIAYDIMKEERLRKIDQLISSDTIATEKRRAEKDFADMIKIRGQGFVPLFLTIVNKIDKDNMRALVIALYCKIVHQLERIDHVNVTYRFKLRHIIKAMIQKHSYVVKEDICSVLSEKGASFLSNFFFIENLLLKYDKHLEERKQTHVQSDTEQTQDKNGQRDLTKVGVRNETSTVKSESGNSVKRAVEDSSSEPVSVTASTSNNCGSGVSTAQSATCPTIISTNVTVQMSAPELQKSSDRQLHPEPPTPAAPPPPIGNLDLMLLRNIRSGRTS